MMNNTVEGLDTAMPNQEPDLPRGEQDDQELTPGVKLLRTIEGHKDTISSIAFDPKGLLLASGAYDKTVKLWDFESGALLRTLDGHRGTVFSVAFDPAGRILASGSFDTTVRLWDVISGKLLRTLVGHQSSVSSVAFDSTGKILAGGGRDRTVKLWEVASGKLLRILEGHTNDVVSLAFDPTGSALASASRDDTVRLWDVASGKLLRVLEGHGGFVFSVAFDPTGQTLASGSRDNTVKLWEVATGKLLRILEGHTRFVEAVAFSADGRLLAAKSNDGTLRVWNCESWEMLSVIPEPTRPDWRIPALVFHPSLPLLATVGSKRDRLFRLIHLWDLDLDRLMVTVPEGLSTMKAVHHTTAKIVLVGDSGVGKTGLGWRLAHGEFKEHSSTHGQQFWVISELGKRGQDGIECDAILWDLAGQPDYRLTHALFLDDADLALVLFDPTDNRDPLHGVEFWLKHLKARHADRPAGEKAKKEARQEACSTILVGARADRGEARLTKEELDAFCDQRGIIGGFLSTSASSGDGLTELVQRMQAQIPWDQKPATVTTVTFKRIKDYVLGLKENPDELLVIVSPQDLRKQLETTDERWEFTDDEMMTAVGHLGNYGYVRVLRSSKSGERILLAPELLNNLAASFVLEARRNPKGLGSLEEKQLLAGEYPFRELEKLTRDEQEILLDSAALLFLEHNICFRETDPLGVRSYLVFPELINLKKPPLEDEQKTEDGVAYTVSGAVENVYASLVVLLGFTAMFTRTNQWRNEARYEMGDGLICGFRQDRDHDGELDLVLYFGTNVGRPVRTLFRGLFESFLARRNLSVFRYDPVVCSSGHALNRGVVREEIRSGADSAFCPKCGEKLTLPKTDEPIQLTKTMRREVEAQQLFASLRSRFEQAVFQFASYVEAEKKPHPECFISYAWGDKDQERWVERNLATDLQKAGINVVLDRWENERVGASVARFAERIEACDRVVVVGTPRYREKYENKDTGTGHVAAAEVDLISNRLLGTEPQKETVLPLLLAGDKTSSLPPLLHGRVFADFRNELNYFITAFDLILDLHGISHGDPAVADLREWLRESELRTT